ncbi:unnamed protein product [Vitrella brassicaformis CCMP3155]|uniref:CCR4-NOT transcription complex subunit 11 n=1 Tax=Vitrella brassicaformis (strain CCMP3155) TaxID=1169540 RepID=A0A0G4FDS9_VITBC|nr:unnamed protein product [Vitrella brassicaformis CCMP3155]|mmetsp:Transcript_19688/g.47702  ORF Transcript_19688/g.47702 Transcript_19688/m.47702 type:complete len:414 (-) Transcript_19688:237-1478(-)|eukprot:CEM11360.1 unnamed protein product [Vitrella brassicaformis CCMP3155]
MLSQQELDTLLQTLNDINSPFEKLGSALRDSYQKQDLFKVGSVICILLEDGLLAFEARLVGFYLLYDIYASQSGVSSSPFIPLVLDTIQSTKDERERRFLECFLSSVPKEIHTQSPVQWLSRLNPNESSGNVDLAVFRRFFSEGAPSVTGFETMGVRPSVRDSTPSWIVEEPLEATTLSSEDLKSSELHMLSLEPSWVRPPPPLLDPTADEVYWLQVPLLAEPLWDYSMCVDQAFGGEMKALLSNAIVNSVAPDVQNTICEAIDQDPKLVYHCGLTPQRLTSLIEKNPPVAVKCLEKLMSSAQITDYLSVMLNNPMSLRCMEVVDKLAYSVELPAEFLQEYIARCIYYCSNVSDSTQQRHVRLVCIFIHSLLRNERISVDNVLLEVQAFCIDHAKIKEAASLFKFLRLKEQAT